MKRILSFLLAFVMVFAIFGVIPAFADGPANDSDAVAAGYYFRIGNTQQEGVYYQTWADLATAVNAVAAGDPVQITQLADYTVPACQTFTRALIYEGGGHTLSAGGIYLADIQAKVGGTFTFQNLTINSGKAFSSNWYDGYATATTITLKNVTAHMAGGLLINTNEGGGYGGMNYVILDGCTIDATSGTDPFIRYGAPGRNFTFTVKDTTMTHAKQFTSDGWNATMFNITGNGSTQGNVTINIQNSHITNARTITDTNQAWTTSMFRFRDGSKSTVRVDSTSVLEMGATATAGTYQYVLNTSGSNYHFIDSGATYKLSPSMATRGVTLPLLESANIMCFAGSGMLVGNNAVAKMQYTKEAVELQARAVADNSETQYIAGNIFRVGENVDTATYYTTIADAISGAGEGGTVYLNGHYNQTAAINFTTANMTFNGNGYAWTSTVGYGLIVERTTTFKDLILKLSAQGFSYCPQVSGTLLTLDGVTAMNNGGLFMAAGHTKVTTQAVPAGVTVKDSTITGYGEEPILFQIAGVTWTANIQNSTLIKEGSGSHDYVLNFAGNLTEPLTLTVDGTSKLICKSTHASEADVIFTNSRTATVNLASGAELSLSSASGATSGAFFSSASNLTLNDSGAHYTASVWMQKKGFTLPVVSALTGSDQVLGLTDGAGNLYKVGTAIAADAGAAASKTFTAVGFDNSDFNLTNGASIRTESYTGIRFTTNLSADLLALIDANAVYGTYIVPTRFITAPSGCIATGLSADQYEQIDGLAKPINALDGSRQYYSALVNFPVDAVAYKTQLSAQSYFTFTYADGATATFYTAYNAVNNSRSLYQVATALKALPGYETTPFVEAIIQTVVDAGLN